MPIVGASLMPHPPIMIEAVGKGESHKTDQTTVACKTIAEVFKTLAPDTIVLITPHGAGFHDAVTLLDGEWLEGDLAGFGAPQVSVRARNDRELLEKLVDMGSKEGSIPVAAIDEVILKRHGKKAELDHGAVVPLHFMADVMNKTMLLHVTYTSFDMKAHYLFGQMLKAASDALGRRIAVIASGDLSHKLPPRTGCDYSPMGEVFDARFRAGIERGDSLDLMTIPPSLMEEAGVCAPKSLAVLMGCFDRASWRGEVLSYEAPFGVGYLTAVIQSKAGDQVPSCLELIDDIEKQALSHVRNAEDAYVKLARLTLESYVKGDMDSDAIDWATSDMLNGHGGVFVSIKKDGALRGCIGTFLPTQDNIAMEILENAVKSGTEDPRFPPIMASELESLVYSVDVLGAPEPIGSKAQLDVKRYGVIVRHGHRQGLLLPDLEGVDTIEEQLAIACRKAGIPEDAPYEILRFEVERHR